MTTAEAPEVSSYLAGRAASAPARRSARRDEFEVVGLLLGILGVLLVVVVTLGTTPGLS
jgi:hypothetical protein